MYPKNPQLSSSHNRVETMQHEKVLSERAIVGFDIALQEL